MSTHADVEKSHGAIGPPGSPQINVVCANRRGGWIGREGTSKEHESKLGCLRRSWCGYSRAFSHIVHRAILEYRGRIAKDVVSITLDVTVFEILGSRIRVERVLVAYEPAVAELLPTALGHQSNRLPRTIASAVFESDVASGKVVAVDHYRSARGDTRACGVRNGRCGSAFSHETHERFADRYLLGISAGLDVDLYDLRVVARYRVNGRLNRLVLPTSLGIHGNDLCCARTEICRRA